MKIDPNVILPRFNKMDSLIQDLEELKKKPKDQFLNEKK
jgi:hypothetical protein